MLHQMVKVCLTVNVAEKSLCFITILYHIIFSHKGTKINSCSRFVDGGSAPSEDGTTNV
jgi:hypothetical protein